MNIKIIDEKEQFAQCETFEITHLLWGTKAIPKTYGKIACWKEHGFLVEMTCEEADPLRTYIKMNDPVSQDSGMEAFLGFWSEQTPLYVNVEMNANGATLIQSGTSVRIGHFSQKSRSEFVSRRRSLKKIAGKSVSFCR